METWCRLCCSTTKGTIHIFDSDHELYYKITTYIPVKIMKDDQLPKKICKTCSQKVEDFYQFCNEAVDVQTRLKTLMQLQSSIEVKMKPQVNVKIEQDDDKMAAVEDEALSPKSEVSDCNDKTYSPESSSDELNLIAYKQRKTVKSAKHKKSSHNNNSLKEPKMEIKSEMDLSLVKNEFNWVCCICFDQMPCSADLEKHVQASHGDAVWIGDEESITYEKIEKAGEPPQYKCTKCKVVKASLKPIKSHLLKHRLKKMFSCNVCAKTFKIAKQVVRHGQTHKYDYENGVMQPRQEEARFICDLCDLKFFYMKSVMDHRKKVHPEAEYDYVNRCYVCKKEFLHLNSLRRHLRTHTGEKRYLCYICGKALSTQDHLKFHIRVHTGYKPHACKTCGKSFSKPINLTQHERTHTGEKPYTCSHCSKSFSQRSTLVIHERYHTGSRPYVCKLCGRGFVAQGLLTVHQKTTCV